MGVIPFAGWSHTARFFLPRHRRRCFVHVDEVNAAVCAHIRAGDAAAGEPRLTIVPALGRFEALHAVRPARTFISRPADG